MWILLLTDWRAFQGLILNILAQVMYARLAYTETPRASATVLMSLSPRPLRPTRMIASLGSVGASLATCAMACEGSRAGDDALSAAEELEAFKAPPRRSRWRTARASMSLR